MSIFKLIILGDCSVGKTSLLQRYVNNNFTERYKATIGADFLNKHIIYNNKKASLQIWDTAGNERFHSLGTAFYRGADACIIVFDLTNPKTFDNLETWIDEFLITGNISDPENFPVILVGNKCDLVNSNNSNCVSENRISKLCNSRNLTYFRTSVKNNINIEFTFKHIISLLIYKYENEKNNDGNINFDSIDLENDYDKNKNIIKLNQNKSYLSYCSCY